MTDQRSELETLSALNDMSSWDDQGNAGHTKAVVDAILTPGERTADLYMRGVIPAEYLPSVVRQYMRGLESIERRKSLGLVRSVDKDTQHLLEMPNPMRQVELFSRFSPAVDGRARGEVLSAFTGGMVQMAQKGRGKLSKLFRRNKAQSPEMAG